MLPCVDKKKRKFFVQKISEGFRNVIWFIKDYCVESVLDRKFSEGFRKVVTWFARKDISDIRYIGIQIYFFRKDVYRKDVWFLR